MTVARVFRAVAIVTVLVETDVTRAQSQLAGPLPEATRPADGFSYSAEGRRDPFVSLLTRGFAPDATGQRVEGIAGLSVDEISLKGIVRSRGGFVAMVQGPDSRTYIVHALDQLLDGSIKAITEQDLVMTQDVNDPLSVIKQRDVRRSLRSVDEVK